MKRGFVVLICLLPFCLLGQTPNNWINFGQSYYRIPVAQDGVYRLTYTDLQNAGFPVGTVDTRFIQVFHRGTEQAILFKHDNPTSPNATFEATEYIEFFGQQNDGTLDTKLYQPSSSQPHTYYNLYTDTSAYFLTWNILPVQGKRMVTSALNNVGPTLPKETNQTAQRLIVNSTEYSGGETLADVIQYSYFNQGEGWTGATICSGSSGCTGQADYVIDNLSGVVSSGAAPQLEVQLAGRDDLLHSAEVYVGANSGSLRMVASQTFVNYETPTITVPLTFSDIGSNGKMTVRITALGVGGERDRISLSYVKVNFPQNFDLTGLTEKRLGLLPNGSNLNSYIEITNAGSSARLWDITDVNNIVNITDPNPGTIFKAVVPNTSAARTLWVSTSFITPTLKKVSFRKITPSSHNYLIVTHKSLMSAGLGYSNAVGAYAAYRASAEGGGYDTLTVTIDQLYNQFNYGETSSLAIYEFMKFMYTGGKPQYLFLIGKGREINAGFFRKTTLAAGEFRDLVPVGGYPASDMVFTAGLNKPHVAAVATGRITASTAAQVAAYLNKVKETEAASLTDSWHKQVLHLSGGIQPGELTLFRQYMDDFAKTAQGEFYGGSVKTLGKHEATAIELINISKEVNNGVNMVSFFGHSAPNATDIDIGYASDPLQGYNNPGKYPAFLVNGCSAGEFFNNLTNFGEDWILTANKGARNFIANSSYGFSNNLKFYSDLFYQVGYADSAGIRSGIGNVQMEVANRYLTASSGDITSVSITQQMVLLGDPALKLFPASKPDLEITNTSISAIGFDNKPVTALADSFALKLIVKNYGVITKDSLKINVTRTFSDNTSVTYSSVFRQPYRQDTLTFVINQLRSKGFGDNIFTVVLDPDNAIDELREDNNKATLSLFIPLNGTRNLFPAAYSIVRGQNAVLVFQNTNLMATSRSYLMEIDTAATFSSTALKQFKIEGKVLMRQSVSLFSRDSTVYYWRTKLAEPLPDENSEWQTSSFAFIQNSSEGWTQMQFPQFADDVTSGLIKDPVLRNLQYVETSTSLFVRTFGKDNVAVPTDAALTIDGVDYWHSIQGFNCRDNTINLLAFDKNTVVPYQGIPFTYLNSGGRACGREPQLIISFQAGETDTGNNDDLIQYVDNIHASDSVVLFTLGDAGIETWSASAKNKLGEFGISVAQLEALLPGEPVIILGRKGAAVGTARIIRSSLTPEADQELTMTETLTGKLSSGSLQSTTIGPASAWKNFTSRITDITSGDEVRFDLYGIKLNGTEELIQSDIGTTFDLSSIDALVYPQLKLIYFTKDDTNLTAAQLKKWFVFFDPVAEGLLMYHGATAQQTFQEGTSWTGNYSFINISEKPFKDSLSVEVEVLNKTDLTSQRKDFRIKAPAPGDSTKFEITSTPKSGLNDVDVYVNRRIQPELYYDNNTIELPDYLNVLADDIGPVLDVSIDGRYIQNGDYVSPHPNILITVKDENALIFKTDTTGVEILLKAPCATSNCSFSRINFSRKDVTWTPATSRSDFKVLFNPTDLAEGEYTLRVQASDARGNNSGEDPYEVVFNVMNETTVTFVPAYPNPSSSGFYFRFILTGQQELDKFNLQIWSSDGRKLNDFTEEDLTNPYIGTHELKWTGTDKSGNVIQPGVYIYRMEVGADGKNSTTHGKLVVIH